MKKWVYTTVEIVALGVLALGNSGEVQCPNKYQNSHAPATQSTSHYTSSLDELSRYLVNPSSGIIDMDKKREAWSIMGLEVIVKNDSVTLFPKPTESQVNTALKHYRIKQHL